MLKNKVIFLDIDGTLVDRTLQVPESAAEAIKKAKANGHKLYLNTGRSRCQVFDHIWEVGFDGFIGGNGIYIEENGKKLFHRPIPEVLTNKVIAYLEENENGFFVENNISLYANRNYLPSLARLLDFSVEDAFKWTTRVFPSTTFDCTEWHMDANKISVVLTDDVDIEKLKQFISPELTLGLWNMTSRKRGFSDIFQDGTSKGKAVEFIMNRLGKPLEDAYGFGDSDNDIEMIETAGIGVAMGNAIPQLKAVADHITDHVTEDGLANAFKHVGLID